MSHANHVYPQTTTRGLTLRHPTASLCQVREDEGEYTPEPRDESLELCRLSAAINDKLLKAEAVAWLLSEYTFDEAITNSSTLLAQLIEEAREAHNELWEKLIEGK